MSILSNVKQLGQQIWLDNLSRSLVQSGELAQFLQNGVCGVTSNPAIFQKAFPGDPLYTPEIAALKAKGLGAKEIYETLAIADVQAACDVCRAEFDSTNGKTGFVSLEVSPELSRDTAGTVAEAKRLHAAINRPNAMIKVPATDEGLVALVELLAEGISVNLTLLFSRTQTLKAYDAYVAGIEKALAAGRDVRAIQVVASFFISRVDNALDATLPEALQGTVAISLAKAAYQDWQQYFAQAAFAALAEKGANPVSLLWASTGVKNPAYSDTLYVDSLIGAHTVNTVPDATLAAFIDHGTAALTLPEQTDVALANIAQAAELGIDLETLATRLQNDGLKQFEDAFAKLLAPLA
ncbi:transaldolase [Kingella kingae]|uniref:transaldolase n=1 Tax=Kingella kingae TaxID=504 RepID=UPI0002EB540E|nr:transaldolase [Kingella kingae]MDK4556283.1 transaldolase [Kingella kingae]MDK4585373.1 transaldolase [Kingella kingae]MDK4589358.1 transaldolase [Kingella kingae]MDK4611465.1 transaldolase [Kingella kingae]MDK4643244.1 transaldolase [Kingella kingae]